MANVFMSPGVYTAEQDFSVFASQIGITRLGLVGLTQRGPAFLPIVVNTSDKFNTIFGGTDPTLPLSYVANAFLAQSNQLTVTRVLGSTGFENSPAWLIVADNSITYSGAYVESGMTFSVSEESVSTGWTFTTNSNASMLGAITASTLGNDTTVTFNPTSGSVSTTTWLNTINSTAFSGFGISVVGNSVSSYVGVDTFTLSANTIESKGKYSGATLAILRSRRNQITNDFYFNQEEQIQLGNITSTLGTFSISASTGPLTAVTNSGYTVSLDETSDHYIVKLLGKSPLVVPNQPLLYVERIYSHFIREASVRGDITNIKVVPVFSTEAAYEDFNNGYTNAVTPWVVSRVVGGQVVPLFRFQTIADGDTANSDIKVSIANIDIVNNVFDVQIRNFADTDATAVQGAYEIWGSVSLDPTTSNYIGKVIGTTDGTYPQKSMFVTVDIADNILPTLMPAGFEGYEIRGTGISGTTSGQIYYKTDYFSGDSIFKTYLGISELGYTSFTQSQVSSKNSIKTVEVDLFQYDGGISTGLTYVKGFHLENTADPTKYVSGSKNSLTAYTNPSATLIDKTQLKFTLVPHGGFDGFDKYEDYASPCDQFTDAYTSNVAAFQAGIDTMSAPEVVDINLFATPGVDFENNTSLVNYALTMIESRADSLYIIESPRLTAPGQPGVPEEVVALMESTGIDSNYAATYWPWIQILDSSQGVYTYQPPTMMVVNAIAYTDNVAAPWFAPAGINRGVGGPSIIRADIRLTQSDRDTLYNGRINPIATFIQQGVVIWGQKTLQSRNSALNRVNIRRLLLQVQRLIAAASLTLVFEQNDQTLWSQFLAKVEPILQQIQNQRGLTAFNVVMDSSNNTDATIDQNMLIGKIQIKPTRTAEFINLTFQVLPTGANFSDF